jgi:hypothetical protein
MREKSGLIPLVNLGAGERTSPVGINFDNSPYYALRHFGLASVVPSILVGAGRHAKLKGAGHVMRYHNLRKGIPLPDASVEAICHGHYLEHIDRSDRHLLMAEIHRVLIPGGIHRVWVPDLAVKLKIYDETLKLARGGMVPPARHERSIANIYQQSVRRESASTRNAAWPRRLFENLVLGDARRRGETHQWMYDEVTLSWVLEEAGFIDPCRAEPGRSAIKNWAALGLELDEDENEHAPGSLYMEAAKPGG